MFSLRTADPWMYTPAAMRQCFGFPETGGMALHLAEMWHFGHQESVEAIINGRTVGIPDRVDDEQRWEIFQTVMESCRRASSEVRAAPLGRVRFNVVQVPSGAAAVHLQLLDDGTRDERMLCCLEQAAETLRGTLRPQFPEGGRAEWIERFE